MYEQNGRLGHPTTMKRIFERLPGAGFIEERYGYDEWSDKAFCSVYPHRKIGISKQERDFLWAPYSFDWYIEEAKLQWKWTPDQRWGRALVKRLFE